MSIENRIDEIRSQFPALRKMQQGKPAVFLDGPAGTQVPQRVIDAISQYLVECNANHGGLFLTSRENDEWMEKAHQAFADFVGSDDANEIVFGQNMTSLTYAFSRALAKTWEPGEEIVVTRLDHDANISPWVQAANEAGVTVRFVDFRMDDMTLDLDHLQQSINENTRLVAIGAASNATGGVNPVAEICDLAHEFGALVFVDAVHYGPHGLIDVGRWDCDFLCCSAYKFFGTHLGIMWGRRDLLEMLDAFKVRPAENTLPGKWMTGTQSFEAIAGGMACVDYLASLAPNPDDEPMDRRQMLEQSFEEIGNYETKLARHFLDRVADIPEIKIWGITDPELLDHRFSTFSITHSSIPTSQLAQQLSDEGIFVWHGNYYALEFTETLGLEPEGMVRIGLVHYNTLAEVDRLIETLTDISRRSALVNAS